ncbi:MAG: hypothetical protein M3Q74_05435, partial [Pseudomonadota bacterium]|nr:hypothetical protein [Pseudomonadota bacterium]
TPPIQKFVLDTIFSKIRPGGGALFQIATDLLGYSFDAEAYLQTPDLGMEMHSLPRPVVLKLLSSHGLNVAELTPDNFTGMYGSETFYVKKRL